MVRSGGVSQDGSDRERKMAYEQRVARRERSERRRRAVTGDLEDKRETRVSNLEGERKPRDPTSRLKNLAWFAERRRSVREA